MRAPKLVLATVVALGFSAPRPARAASIPEPTATMLFGIVALQQPSVPAEIPSNLHSGVYRRVVEAMWEASPTFRHQCERLAARPALTVKLVVDLSRTPDPAVRASAEISRKNGTLVFARVLIHSPDGTVELIAHEIEHVIEQIEGLSRPALESTRAIEVGRRVAREVEQGRRTTHMPVTSGHAARRTPSVS